MNEIPKILEPNEKMLWDGKPDYIAYMVSAIIGSIIISIILAIVVWSLSRSIETGIIGAVVVFPLSLIVAHLSYNITHYAITNKRAIMQKGIIGRDFESLDYDRIQNVSVDVDLLGVIFKVGTVKMFTGEMIGGSSRSGSSIRPLYHKFSYIPNAYDTVKLLQQILEQRKEQLYGGKVAT